MPPGDSNQEHDTTEGIFPLPRAWLHDVRHVHATTLLPAGVPVHVDAAQLGHADTAITRRVYSHVVTERPKQPRSPDEDRGRSVGHC
ncbi:tyrosine-type recombinase/integrase [Actinomadura sp. K4S16]|uniref:tyrosine-type recombinase/integrase n=1 Tax=Actinomadura sp. K4S16 TaxID=1316147 RepID=UPI0011F099FE